MADIEITPTPPTPYEGPYMDFDYLGLGPSDTITIIAGEWRDVPQHWDIDNLRLKLTASAVVANRSVWLWQYRDLTKLNVQHAWRTPAIAASADGGIMLDGSMYALGSPYNVIAALGISRWTFKGTNLLFIQVAAGQVGDLWDFSLTLKYLNKELGVPTPWDMGDKGG